MKITITYVDGIKREPDFFSADSFPQFQEILENIKNSHKDKLEALKQQFSNDPVKLKQLEEAAKKDGL